MISRKVLEGVGRVYNSTLFSLDTVLVGQEQVKKVVATSLLCDTSSKLLFTGNTGMGKTTLAEFLASAFLSERISVTSDMIPSDVQERLQKRLDMQLLWIDEFNRTSGKVQDVFIELFAEKQMTIGGVRYPFGEFYVIATQNSADITGIFNVSQATYDRFDVNIFFENLNDAEKRTILFDDFTPEKKWDINTDNLPILKRIIDGFHLGPKDQDIMMKVFNLIDSMKLDDQPLFGGSNIRAHKFALRLVKLYALTQGRETIMPTDILDYLDYVYMHRINQNVAKIGDKEVIDKFDDAKNKINSIRRKFF